MLHTKPGVKILGEADAVDAYFSTISSAQGSGYRREIHRCIQFNSHFIAKPSLGGELINRELVLYTTL
jgi:hypothetical protein